MPNPLTGDFEAVLQISGGTINRLMATMHQNAGVDPKLPSHPHSISIRIGETHPIAGVRGWVDAQIGVTRISLIHGASDRFDIEVDVRARYLPDSGATRIPEFIHGIIYAQYRVYAIDPDCPGWRTRAADYLWIRVVKDSVRFAGSANDEFNPLDVATAIVDEQQVQSQISRQIAALLATRFEAAPHKVSKRFRSGGMRSLSAPIGGSALAVALSLSDDEPRGNIASINTVLLDDSDFVVAFRIEFLMAMVEPTLAAIRAFSPRYKTTFSNPFRDVIIHHQVRVTAVSTAWEAAGGDYGIVRIKVAGAVESSSSVAPSITFSVNQAIMVAFDAGAEVLRLTALDPGVNVSAKGVFATQSLVNKVYAAIKSAVKKEAEAVALVVPSVGAGRGEMVAQLRTFDEQANGWFDYAVFTSYGVVLHGSISLSSRHKPIIQFRRLDDRNGYSAYASWMPGGRIDRFAWSWNWTIGGAGGAASSASRSDRFILRRPSGKRSRWGFASGGEPLPGLDGFGVLCLTIQGVYVDAVTGSLVSFESKRCTSYGANIGISRPAGFGRLFQKLWPEVNHPSPHPEYGLVDVGAQPFDPSIAANTLVLHVGRRWDRNAAEALARGLEASRRRDAGLTLLVLVEDSPLVSSRQKIAAEVEALASQVGLAALLVDDVDGAWSARLAMPLEPPAWRLVSPAGGISWMHDGRLDGEVIARALDNYLMPSPPAHPVVFEPALEIGMVIPALSFRAPGFVERESRCPPLPIGRLGTLGAVVTFVHSKAASSQAQLRELYSQHDPLDEDAALLLAIVDGDSNAAEAMMATYPNLVALPDSDGRLSHSFGIRVWPTTVRINDVGTVASIAQGLSVDKPMPGDAGRGTSEKEI